MKVTENRVAYVSCALIVSVFIECFSWFPSIPSLLKFKSKVPTLTNRVAGVSCVLIVSVFIECFFIGFPETMSDPENLHSVYLSISFHDHHFNDSRRKERGEAQGLRTDSFV